MIQTREQLIHTLTEAAEIEHNLLCSYLYAAFSLKRAGEPGLTEDQAQAVEGWRKTILKIALQEMAHLACVNNLLVAVGGAAHFDRPNFPVAPGYHPADMVVRLTPFDEATLDHFIFLERPEGSPLADGAGFEPSGAERRTIARGLTPSAQDYATVGELYGSIADALQELATRLGEANLIDVEGRGQVDTAMVGLPNIPRITDLATALAVVEQIKEEGEGSTGSDEESHFDRFQAVRAEWDELKRSDPSFHPAWPAAHDPVMRRPVNEAERVWITEPDAAAHLDLANATYGAMLGLLSQVFGGTDVSEQKLLMLASVEMMEASAAVSTTLARMPANPDMPGVNAGMTFAMPRNLGYRPLAPKVRAIFLERALHLRAGAERVLVGGTAEKALRRLDNAVALLRGEKM